MKKLLVILVLLVTIPVIGQVVKRDGILYRIEGNEAYVCKTPSSRAYIEQQGKIVIASSIEHRGVQYPVTKILSAAFQFYENITAVEIPGSVKVIEENAFCFCEKLKEAYLHEGVEEIKSGALLGISTLVMPRSLQKIGFNSYDSDAKVMMSEEVESLTYVDKKH